ncbi:bifunctional adenosylcobinamide kinase/adenosylcobinamide-phosphate guanylyltransferase [Terrabacter sp. 2YAF2]|uniref:bifunctional adenosylcobinamide kinase/adenosylcobinamide-phosphate guanylyltransferase n=1 Tax=Terrabacter sp. 2YAF2 TaxID=3233026 RepID=UPI003F99EA20
MSGRPDGGAIDATGASGVGAARSTTLITGPVRSGKSRHAEDLLRDHSDVTYVATGRRADPSDPEWSRRVHAHRGRRPESWLTVETVDVPRVIAGARGPVLVDCLGTWITAVVDDAGWDDLDSASAAVARQGAQLVESLCTATVPVVVVTNEVGWSLVPTTASGRLFQDELGRLNALVAGVAARVHVVVAGRVIDLSDAPVVPREPRPRTLDA